MRRAANGKEENLMAFKGRQRGRQRILHTIFNSTYNLVSWDS